jgi:hypothetical protein
VIQKIVPKAGHEKRKSSNERKEKQKQKFDAAFKFVSVSKKQEKNFLIVLSLTRQAKNLKTLCPCKKVLCRLSKKSIWGPSPNPCIVSQA